MQGLFFCSMVTPEAVSWLPVNEILWVKHCSVRFKQGKLLPVSDTCGPLCVKPPSGKIDKSVGNQTTDIKQLSCRTMLSRQPCPVVAVATVNVCQRYTPPLAYLPGHSMKDHPGRLFCHYFCWCDYAASCQI